jgi:TolA-binding protein
MARPLTATRRPRRGDDHFQFRLGAYRYRNGDYRRAAEAFRYLVDRYEESSLRVGSLFWLAASLYRAGDWEESEKTFRIFLSGDAEGWMKSTALVSLGWISQRRGRVDDALSYYRQFMDGFPDSASTPLVTYLLGDAFFRLEQYEAAAEQFQRAYQITPGGKEKDRALFWWAESRRQAGAFPEARKLYASYLKRYGGGEFSEAARYGMAWCSLGERNYGEAGKAFAELSAAFPRSPLADEALFLAAWSYFRDEDWSRAVATCDETVRNFPASPRLERVLRLKALSLLAARSFEEVLAVLEHETLAAGEGPLAEELVILRAEALMGLGRHGAARALLEGIVESDLESGRGLVERIAWAAFMTGDTSAARNGFARALDQVRDEAAAAEIHYWNGIAAHSGGDPTKAVLSFGKAIAKLPGGDRADDALSSIADIYFSQGKWREAGDLYARITGLPERSEFHDIAHIRLAESRAGEGRVDEALEILLDYLGEEREGSLAAQALFEVGRLHSRERRFEKARKELQKLIDEHPQSAHVDDARYQIALGLFRHQSHKPRPRQLRRIPQGVHRLCAALSRGGAHGDGSLPAGQAAPSSR